MAKNKRPDRAKREALKSFVVWVKVNQSRFQRPIRVRRTLKYVGIEILGLNPAIRIKMSGNDLTISMYLDNLWFDCICWLEMYPVKREGRFVCTLCEEDALTFCSAELMREDHLYEPFLAWCNNKLNDEHVLQLWTTTGGSRAAEVLHRFKAEAATGLSALGQHQRNHRIWHLPLLVNT